MNKPTVECALLAALVAKHGWGTPIGREQLLSVAAVESDELDRADEVFDELGEKPYVRPVTPDRVELDTDSFGRLADILYYECEWNAFQVKSRLKHYEGWERHEWA